MFRLSLFLLSLLVLATGCGSPLQGGWAGTIDIGPIEAYDLKVTMPEEGLDGTLLVRTAKGTQQYSFCKGSLDGQQFELHYDLARPTCEDKEGAPTDPRRLVGTLGESVLFGEVYKGSEKVGFFRAFLEPPPAADLKTE